MVKFLIPSLFLASANLGFNLSQNYSPLHDMGILSDSVLSLANFNDQTF